MGTTKPKKDKKYVENLRFYLFLFLLALFIISGAGIYMFFMRSIYVESITVAGNKRLKTEEVIAAAKLKKREPLFAVSGDELYSRLRTSPWIKEAYIRRNLTGKVEIMVQEAVPMAVLKTGDSQYLVDTDGVLLEKIKDGAVLFLPLIADINPSTNSEAFSEAVKLVKTLQNAKNGFYEKDVEITGARPEEISMRIDGMSVKIGVGNLEKKLDRFVFVRDETKKRGVPIEYIDLRFANEVVVKPVGNDNMQLRDMHKERNSPGYKRGNKKKE